MAVIRFRRGPAATWASVNPVLSAGEPGYATDTGVLKIGDGSTAWSGLPAEGGGGGGGATDLDGLTDVVITSPALGHVVRYDGAHFVNVLGTDHYQGADADLAAIAALTSGANRVLYATGVNTWALADFTAFGRSLVDDADAAAALTTLGVTAFVKTLLDDPDATTVRSTLGLGSAAQVNTGTSSGDVPLLSTGGRLPIARLASGTPDGTKYVRDDGTLVTPPTGGGGGATNLDGLSDVVITTPATGHLTRYDGTSWVNVLGSDYFQAADAELAALAGLTSAANKLPYFTGSGTAALADLTAFARTLLDDADAATALATLGAQAADTELTALAGLTSAADRLPYFTGSGTASLATFTTAARALLDDADASAMLTTLGISTFVKTLLDDTTAGAFLTTLGVSTFVQTLLDDTDAATARTTIGAAPAKSKTTTTSSATPTPTGSAENNQLIVTALAANAAVAAPTGTAVDGNMLTVRITSDASVRTVTWDAIYTVPITGVALLAATTASKTWWGTFMYNAAATKWQLIAAGQEA